MRSLKPVLFSLVIIFLVVVVVQNIEFFMYKKSLRLNLLLWRNETRPIPMSVYFLGFFLIGLFLSYIYGLSERFRAKRTINNHVQTIRKLEEEIKAFKSLPIVKQTSPPKETESA